MADVQYSQTLLQGASQDQIVLFDVAIICINHGHKNLHYHIKLKQSRYSPVVAQRVPGS
jgi:hypothetical protein